MGEDDTLWIARAARSVLHERHRLWTRRYRMVDASGLLEAGNGFDVPQVLRQSNQQGPDIAQLRRHNQKAGLGIAQDASLAAQMLLDLGAPERRIERNRYAARVEHAEESFEE